MLTVITLWRHWNASLKRCWPTLTTAATFRPCRGSERRSPRSGRTCLRSSRGQSSCQRATVLKLLGGRGSTCARSEIKRHKWNLKITLTLNLGLRKIRLLSVGIFVHYFSELPYFAVLTVPSIPSSGSQSFQSLRPPRSLHSSSGHWGSILRPRLMLSYTWSGSKIWKIDQDWD